MSSFFPGKRGRVRRAVLAVAIVATGVFLPAGRALPLDLAQMSLVKADAEAVKDPAHLAKGLEAKGLEAKGLEACLDSYCYCTGVGGVAFGSVAKGAGGLQVVALAYDANRPDGQRLLVTVADAAGKRQAVTAAIYDWQLVPIARFAKGDQYSCFTLFGKLKDPRETARHRAAGHYIMNYHPALAETLLGLRIFQADILLLYPDAGDLPKEKGAYVLGEGEAAPDVVANRTSLRNVRRRMQQLPGGPFQSYVICDVGAEITFSAADGRLVMTGWPIWHCWKSRTNNPAQVKAVQDRANAEGNRALNQELQKEAVAMGPAAARAKYTKAYCEQLHRRVWDRVVSKALLVRMGEYSRALSAEIRAQRGINPAVYSALVKMMRFAALFRAYKAADPKGYEAFVKALGNVPPRPAVETPTVLFRGQIPK